MKKRILASFLALAVMLALFPATALAEDGIPAASTAEAITSENAAAKELPEAVPEKVQAFLDAVEALEETEESVNACGTAYDALTVEEQAREDVSEAYLTFMAVVERLNPIMLLGEGAEGTSPEYPIEVPEEKLLVDSKGVLTGIDPEWIENQPKGEDGKLYVSVSIPASVTEIGKSAFKYNSSSGCALVVLDFSNAESLTKIDDSAAQYSGSLAGVLDLSGTKVTQIGKMAFDGCTGLTGMILPDTLEELGSQSAGSGSAFRGCSGLQFIRREGGDTNAVFELPESLNYIGQDTFKDCFTPNVDAKVVIPESVETIGSQAFYSSRISQIVVKKQGDAWNPKYTKYDVGAFKTGNPQLLIIFNDAASYMDYSGKHPSNAIERAMTYPIVIRFDNTGVSQEKLNYQSIKYTKIAGTDFWEEESYELPSLDGTPDDRPGYDYSWVLSNQTLKNDSIIKTNLSRPIATLNYTIQLPTIEFVANGEIQESSKMTVTVDDDESATVGIQVSHPLLAEENCKDGEEVYFKYCWWDEYAGYVNGPRSEAEPDLFSSAESSMEYTRIFTDEAVIPIKNKGHERTDGNYYLVEIFGYIEKDGSSPTLFYQSAHNFIGGKDGEAIPDDAPCHLIEVTVNTAKYYSVTLDPGEGSLAPGTVDTFEIEENAKIPKPADPTREGYTFSGWYNESTSTEWNFDTDTVTGPLILTAHWERVPTYTLTIHYIYSGGSTAAPAYTAALEVGETYSVKSPDVAGYTADKTLISGVMPADNVTVTVVYTLNYIPTPPTPPVPVIPDEPDIDIPEEEVPLIGDPGLNAEEHFAYIAGYPDGTVRPQGKITRAEVAVIFYRLLTEESRDKYRSQTNSYSDVPAESWYSAAVSTLSSASILSGYPDGTFRPHAPITRAEFMKLAVSFLQNQDAVYAGTFTDVTEGQWFTRCIASAVEEGIAGGYPDGTFRPNEGISRAEACAIINRTLSRKPHRDHLLPWEEMVTWPDNAEPSAWYYADLQEATNSHSYERRTGGDLLEDWIAAKPNPVWDE